MAGRTVAVAIPRPTVAAAIAAKQSVLTATVSRGTLNGILAERYIQWGPRGAAAAVVTDVVYP